MVGWSVWYKYWQATCSCHVMQNYFLMQLSNENIKLPPHDTARHGDLLTKQPINVAGDVSNDTISLLWVQVI